MSIPHLLRCPISLDLFSDPVTLSTGQTYDRPSIEKWLADGNLTCPVTMQRLHDPTLVPNHTLRHLIDQWLLTGPDLNSQQKGPSLNHQIDNTDFSLSTLKRNLQSPHQTSSAAKLETLRKIRILSVESDTGQARLIRLGFFPLLLQLLFQGPRRLQEWEPVEVALDCILSLNISNHKPCSDTMSKRGGGPTLDCMGTMLRERSNLDTFANLLDQGTIKIKTSLCCLLEAIATSESNQDVFAGIGQRNRVVIQVLVSLLNEEKSNPPAASEAAARAISGICLLESNRESAIREGAVSGIVKYLSSSSSSRRDGSRALATLEVLLGLESGKMALLKNPDGIRILVRMVFRVSSDASDGDGSEHAVGSLLVACCSSASARVEAVNAGVLTQLLRLLQSQCGSKAKTKARALLKLLRSKWVEDTENG